MSRRTAAKRAPSASATCRAANFSSVNVSMREMRGTFFSITSSKACVARTVSPMTRINACGIVPTGSVPRSSALATTATPSQPPRYAARSIIGAIAGCIRRAPKLISLRSAPAASRQCAARVAMPEAWQIKPSTAVS